ncbi:MAG: hypothetical protein V7719_14160 [Psychroserpens sp.]|uniref:hypothetical protein n=1 Tax=Psychroserpens sp. TaxID=2020870 RepID=UPI0030037EE4
MITSKIKSYIDKSVLFWLATPSLDNIQKGFQLKGSAEIINNSDDRFQEMEHRLLELTKGKYPFSTITAIQIECSKPIISTSYLLYLETKEEDQIESLKKTYHLG